jgi:pSer/pThr/pTyr-binding forkhead associated (FHA) protein
VVVEDDSLSRHHLAIEHFGDEMLWVRDLESTNGSRVDGKPLTCRVAIAPGDALHVGRVKMDVAIGDATPSDLEEIPSRRVVFGQDTARA